MKIYTIALALAVVAPAVAANGYNTNVTSDYYTTKPATKSGAYKTTTTTRKNGGYSNSIQNNFYYPSQQRATSSYEVVPAQTKTTTTYSSNYNDNYRYDNRSYNNYNDGYVVRERQTTTRTYSTQERKYFLAHPFFQPLKGRFGSVTDFAYAGNSFKFDVLNANAMDLDSASSTYGNVVSYEVADYSAKEQTRQFLVKEDFSFGITDTLAVIVMGQYDSTKTKFKDWSTGDPTASYSSSGLNLFGIGIQDRFVDNDEWIAMISAYYQHQRKTANTFIGELKAGYKIDRTTVYGLLRAGYSRLTKGDIYGAYVEGDGDYMMLSYKTDTKDIFQIEGGLGAFAVLNKYFTLNGELIYGHYDWHEQLNIKGAIGWQPGDMFALNLNASTSLYDSASDKKKEYFMYDVNPDVTGLQPGIASGTSVVYTTGDYKLKDYNEWKIGVQAILYF